MSTLVVFGIAVLAVFAVLVILFILVLVLGGQEAEPLEERADEEAIDEAFHAHGVRFG